MGGFKRCQRRRAAGVRETVDSRYQRVEKGLDINQRDSAGNTVLGDPLIQGETGATFDEIRATLARLGGKI